MTDLASAQTSASGILSWIVPPLIVPIAFGLMIAGVALYRAFG